MLTRATVRKRDDELQVVYAAVPGYPGYVVDSDGRVITPRGNTLSPIAHKNGYVYVDLRRCNVKRRFAVHRLVLTAFDGPCPEGRTAGHRNGARADNRLSNLAWQTPAQQLADKERHGTYQRGERASHSKLTERKVRAIKRRIGAVPYSTIAEEFGVSKSTIGAIARGRKWSHVA